MGGRHRINLSVSHSLDSSPTEGSLCEEARLSDYLPPLSSEEVAARHR